MFQANIFIEMGEAGAEEPSHFDIPRKYSFAPPGLKLTTIAFEKQSLC